MSHYINQQQSPVTAYPAVGQVNPSGSSYVTAPPPMGYPTKDGPAAGYPQQSVPPQTTSRGDGFWEGCCAAICCCCALDCCL